MKKVLQIVPHYVPAYHYGGALQVAHSLGKALVTRGCRVYVCTTNLKDSHETLDIPIDTPVDVDGVTVYYEPVSLLRYWGFSPQLWKRVSSEIVDADVVLVHAHYQFANWVGAWLARKARKPYIIFAHGSLHLQSLAHNSRWLKRVYLASLERRNFRDALFIAFNAPEEKDYSLYSDLGKVVPSGIDPSDFAEVPPSGYFRQRQPDLLDKPYFLFMGRLDVQHKGLDLLVPSFARACRHTNQHLVLAGPNEGRGADQVRQLAQDCGIQERVTLTGLITGKEKLAALNEAQAFVLPSRFEGMSIALLEALYVGLPVLITDQVGLCKEISHAGTGLVVSPDSEAIEQGLRTLMQERVRTKMRGRGTGFILRQYTWDVIARDLMAQIQELIG